jgi:hypothetical protein
MNRGFDIEEMHLGQQRSSRRGIFRTKFTKSHPDPLAEKAVHWAAVKGEETALRLLLEEAVILLHFSYEEALWLLLQSSGNGIR